MATLIGAAVTASPNKLVVVRNSATGLPMAQEEAVIQVASGNPNWRYGANRMHYLFMDEAWPPNSNTDAGSRIAGTDGDLARDRLPLTSHKVSGFTWAQVGVATATVNAAAYSQIVARGNEIAQWQSDNAGVGKWGATFCWTFHHEPNNDIAAQGGSVATAAANWRAATQNIYNLWVSEGVQIWSGGADFSTTTEGLILAVNLIDGPTSNRDGDKDVWWGPTGGGPGAGDTWMDQHCVMYASDPYNRGADLPAGNFHSPAFLWGPLRAWSEAKKVYQASQGRVHIPAIWETGTRLANQYGSVAAEWTNGGYGSATPENWLIAAKNYLRDTWTNCGLWCYWDDAGTYDYMLDNSLALWNTAVTTFTDPTFANASTPLPSAGGPAATTELGMVW